MRTPHLLATTFYLALGALLAGIAALFAPLVGRSGWWLIAVLIFALPALALLIYGLGATVGAIDALWRDHVAHQAAADQADADAEAAYWIAVSRAAQNGVSVAGYLRHAGWKPAAIAELEIRTGRDIDGDGRIGPPPDAPQKLDLNAARALLRWCYMQADGDFGQEKGRAAFPNLYDRGMQLLSARGLVLERKKGWMGRLAYETWEDADRHLLAAWTPVDMSTVEDDRRTWEASN